MLHLDAAAAASITCFRTQLFVLVELGKGYKSQPLVIDSRGTRADLVQRMGKTFLSDFSSFF